MQQNHFSGGRVGFRTSLRGGPVGRGGRDRRIAAALRQVLEPLEKRILMTGAHDEAAWETPGYLPAQHYVFDASDGSLSDPSNDPPLDIALRYVRANANALGATANDLADLFVTSQYTDPPSGITHIYLRQRLNGLDIVNSDINVNVGRDGRVLSVGGHPVANLPAAAVGGAAAAVVPQMTPVAAVESASLHLGLKLTQRPALLGLQAGGNRAAAVSAPDVSKDTIPGRLQYVPTADGLKLAWGVVIRTPDGDHWFDTSVSDADGTLLYTADWVSHAHEYNVLPRPTESPADGPRVMVTNPADPVASPYGWHDTNGVAGPEYTDTRGNNVFAQEDADANNTGGYRPDGGASLVFNFPLDPAQSPSAYRDAAITNLFYWNNLLHDVHYKYGFTEAAGNFQQMNYSGAGLGSDAVQADAQDGSGTNNANFATPPDGQPGRMQMYLFSYTSPGRDGDLDNGIVVHEYGHGVTNRLTGGPANSNALQSTQSGGMGEGWSDFWSLMFTQRTSDTKGGAYPVGTYVLGQAGTGAGIRRRPYSYDMTVDPLTFDAYGTSGTGAGVIRSTEVHNTGEIWASALWDVNWLLVDRYGYDPAIEKGYTGAGSAGNVLTLQLVMDALKLQPANPRFTDARDAILLADKNLTGGMNQREIWTAFARRGLGYSASAGTSANATAVTVAFDLPPTLQDPSVVSSAPALTVGSPLAAVSFTFGKAMDAASFTLADVNAFTGPGGADLRSQITGFSWSANLQTLTVAFNPQTAQGEYRMSIGPDILAGDNAHPMNQDGDATAGEAVDDRYNGSFRYDEVRAQVVSTTPAVGGLMTLQLPTTLDLNFNEAIDAASLGAGDLALSQGTVTGVQLVGTNTVRFTLAGFTTESTVTASLAAGAVTDVYGNPAQAFTGSYTLDVGRVAFAGAFVRKLPAGATAYEASAAGTIGTSTDTDEFTLALVAGQAITLRISPAAGLRPTIAVRDGGGASAGSAAAPVAGKDVLLQTLPVTADGLYTFTVGSAGGSGAYVLWVTLNAALEAEDYGGATNDTQATAQDLDGAFVPVAGGGSLANVVGSLPASPGTVAAYSDGFESGALGPAWTTYSSDTASARIRVTGENGTATGAYAVVMDRLGTGTAGYNLNEAIWTVDLGGRAQPKLTFAQASFGDEIHALPQTFTGHANGDGVAISADGNNWYTVWTPTATGVTGYSTVTVDLVAAAAASGMTLGANFRVKFQQYDNLAVTTDGRAFDDVAITVPASPAAADDYYRFSLNAGESATLAVARQGGTAGHTLRLYDAAGNLLATGGGTTGTNAALSNVDRLIERFVAPAAGTYYVRVSGGGGVAYDLLVAKEAAFDAEPNDTTAGAQPLADPQPGVRQSVAGYLESGAAVTDTITFTGVTTGAVNNRTIQGVGFKFQVGGVDSTAAAVGLTTGPGTTTYVSPPLMEGPTTGILTMTLPSPSRTFGFGIALSTGTAVSSAVVVQLYNGTTLVATMPVSTSARAPYTFSEALFSYSGAPVTSAVLDFNETASSRFVLDNVAFSTAQGAGVDVYSVHLIARVPVTLGTSTSTGGTGQVGNVVNPRLRLLSSDGTELVVDDDSAGDGRNALITYTPTTDGTYFIEVSSTAAAATTGEYVLYVDVPADGPPGQPDLAAASDSGVSGSDNVTSFNNASSATAPRFTIGRTIPGATVTLYADGVVVASAVATGRTVTLTLDGSTSLADGRHVFVARQTPPGGAESVDSAPLAVTVLTVAPAAPTGLTLQATSDSGISNSDGLTNVKTPTFDVTSAGTYFRVYRNGVLIGGSYQSGTTFIAPVQGDGTWTYTVAAVDAAGNESPVGAVASVVTIDTVAPAAPTLAPDLQAGSDSGFSDTDNITHVNTPTFDVTGSPYFRLYRGSTRLSGAYETGTTYGTGLLADGTYVLALRAVDAAGNESAAGPTVSVAIDTAAPATPAAPDLQAGSDGGFSNTDNVTNVVTPTFDVTGSPYFRFYRDGVQVSGDWQTGSTYTLAAQADGTYDYSQVRVDAAGNVSAVSPAVRVTIDTTLLPRPALDGGSDTGVSSSDSITRLDNGDPSRALTILVSGAAAGVTVNVYADGVLIGSAVSAGGTTAVVTKGTTALAHGGHQVTARQVLPSGAESLDSEPLALTVLTQAPAAPSAPDLLAGSDSGVSNTDNITNVTTPSLTVLGTTYYRLFFGGTQIGGDYQTGTVMVPTLPDGTHAFTAMAVDAAGNLSPFSVPLSVTVDTVAPVAPGAADLQAGSDSGVSNTDNITNVKAPVVSVDASEAGVVHVDVNGVSGPAVSVSGSGSYSVAVGPVSASGFRSQAVYTAGGTTYMLVAADVNGDGKLDLVVASPGVPVLLGNGDGTFQAKTSAATTLSARSVAIVDLNGDGKLDIVVAATSSGDVSILRGNGDGTFQAPVTMTVGGTVNNVYAADVNGDGKADVVASGGAGVSVFRGNGDGTFQPRLDSGSAGAGGRIFAADFNGDGKVDVAVEAAAGFSILLGNGDGTFAAASVGPSVASPNGITGGDFNGDGKIDLAFAAYASAGAAICMGNGDGTFRTAVIVPGGYNAMGVAAVDFNRDGKLDVAVAAIGQDFVTVSYGKGDGTFLAGTNYAVGNSPWGIAAGDFNRDGLPDVAAANATLGTVSVLIATGAPGLSDGTHSLTVWAEDLAGNRSAVSGALAVTVDTVAPATPVAPDLQSASDSGVSSTDNITNVNVPVLAVSASPYFRFYRNGTLVGENYATGSTVTSTRLADGTYSFTVAAVDVAGNASGQSVALSVVIDTVAYALPSGTLDTTFGGGAVVTPVAGAASIYDLALQPDGKIVAAGQAGNTSAISFALARYLPDGTLDASFGTGGVVVTATGTNARAVAVLPGGKILAAGGGSPVGGMGKLTFARYNADGSLDTSFGTGGIAATPVAGSNVEIWGMEVLPDQRILTVGSIYHSSGADLVVARFNPDGSLDTSFGTAGISRVGFGTTASFGRDVAVQTDGKIVVSGFSSSPAGAPNRISVARLNSDGTLDTTFNGTGMVTTAVGTAGSTALAVAVQADGRIVVGGAAEGAGGLTDSVVVRYNADGSLDTSFAAGGIYTVSLASTYDNVTDLAIQPDGKIVASASPILTGYAGFAVLRLTTSGAPDPTFGTNGVFTRSVSAYASRAETVLIEPGGRVLAAGTSWAANDSSSGDFAILRLAGAEIAAPRLQAASDSGVSNTDRLTNVTTPTFDVGTPAGHYYRVFRNGTLVSGNYGSGGAFTASAQADGSADWTVAYVDAAGNVSSVSGGLTVAIDTVAPAAPTAAPDLLAGSDSGVSNTDNITNVRTPAFGVVAAPDGTYYRLYRTSTAVVAGYNTGASVTAPAQADGTASWSVAYVDAAGNVSALGPRLTVTIDTVAPAAPVAPDLQSGSDSGVSSTDNITNVTKPTFNVTATEAGVLRLRVDGNDTVAVPLTVTAAGTYSITVESGGRNFVRDVATGYVSVERMKTADLNGDGKADLLALNSGGTVYVSLGSETGSLTRMQALVAGDNQAMDVQVADVDGDGKLDVVVSHYFTSNMYVFRGNGDGTFQAGTAVPTGRQTKFMAIADFNGDSNADVVASNSDGSVTLHLGNGDGTFQTGSLVATTAAIGDVKAGDFNGDGKMDFAAGEYAANSLVVVLGNGNGTFQAVTRYAAGVLPIYLATADFNNDGRLDVATANNTSGTLSVFINNGNGTFQAARTVIGITRPVGMASADFNHDGKADLVVANEQSPGTTVVVYGNGDGTFQAPVHYANAGQARNATTGDFNGDGWADLVTANYSNFTIEIFSSVATSRPADGVRAVTAWAEDLAGNRSTAGAALNVTIDTVAPAAPAAPDLQAASDSGVSNTDNITNAATIRFNVAAAEAGVLRLEVDGQAGPTVTVANAGTYAVSPTGAYTGFRPAVTYASGSTPYSIASGDINSDGKPDLVIPNVNDGTLSLFFGNGDGTFQPRVTVPVPTQPARVALADFNGDGMLDVVVLSFGKSDFVVLRNTGNGTFAAPVTLTAPGDPLHVVTADFDGDGKADLAVSNPANAVRDSQLAVYLGNGDVTFRPLAPVNFGKTSAGKLVAADVDRDGRTDLFVSFAGAVGVFRGNGDGTFSRAADVATSHVALAAGDTNGDGIPDLAVTVQNGTTQAANIFLGSGNGTFTAPKVTAIPWYNPLMSVVLADVNGDAKLDYLTKVDNGSGSAYLTVGLGNGDGTFQPFTTYDVGISPFDLTAADFDRNGSADAAVVNYGNATVSVLTSTASLVTEGDHAFVVRAEDLAGNRSAASAPLTVKVDRNAPVVLSPGNQSFEASGGNVPVYFAPATATDDRNSSPTIRYSLPPGSTFPVGTTAVTAVATDVAGNSSQVTFQVTLVEPAWLQLEAGGAFYVDGPAASPVLHVTAGRVVMTGDAWAAKPGISLSIENNATVVLAVDQKLASLAFSPAATLDLVDRTLKLPSGAALAPVQAITTASHRGRWDLPGITSSAAAGDASYSTGIGYFDDGQNLILRRTMYGDANVDGRVDADDVALVVLGRALGQTAWSDGNFNYDARSDADDFMLMSRGLALSMTQPLPTTAPAAVAANRLPAAPLALWSDAPVISEELRYSDGIAQGLLAQY